MMSRGKFVSAIALLLCAMAVAAITTQAQQGPQRRERDPLGFLKRAITDASAPALTPDQEAQLKSLIINFHDAQPDEPDQVLQAAHDAYNDAILAGELAVAQAQATIIANRSAELSKIRLQALAKFQIDVQAVLKAGGQWELLKTKFGDRLVGIVGSLAGGPGFGGRGPGGGHGFGFGFAPTRKPE